MIGAITQSTTVGRPDGPQANGGARYSVELGRATRRSYANDGARTRSTTVGRPYGTQANDGAAARSTTAGRPCALIVSFVRFLRPPRPAVRGPVIPAERIVVLNLVAAVVGVDHAVAVYFLAHDIRADGPAFEGGACPG